MKAEMKEHEYCLRCGRRLKNPNARMLGYGAVCYRRQRSQALNPLFGVEAKVRKGYQEEEQRKNSYFSTLTY